jgi:hypothetical protein
MMKDPKDVELSYEGYFVNLFQLLEKYDISEHLEKTFYFALNLANAKARKTACLFLTQYSSLVEDRALELLKGKKADERIVAALVLTKSQRKEVIDVLFNCLETETNDEIRDLMLHALQELKFDHVFTKDEVQLMVSHADKRKKLNNWTEKLIDETVLNTLKWHDQELISQKELRFLMYRSKRAKGLNSDLEAKPMLALIDKNSASDFCLTLLKAFQDSNADNKLKYYLSLGAFLGGDQVLNRLHSIFRTAITDKRYKLAESLVGAMAMVGSNKALRLAELISRQFINKKPAIAAAAKEALVAAAEELQISAVQLADRIIPDLGFDGLYKNIDINGEEYRAFVSADFKLNYLNTDNKLRKSLPKEAPKDLAKECKAIETEIADVVKTQKGRLENLMVQEFVWAADEWLQYYYNNPIMNVYVQKVLWAVFNTENQFVTAFYCNEDLIFCDLNDDEVAIDDAQLIKILHPLYLTETELQDWKDKLYDLGLVTMFPILERSIVHLPINNTDEFVTDYNFKNADIPKGADFVAGFLQKRGWIKSTGDGGSLQFGKIDELREIQAYADIEGPAAYFQGGATKATAHNVGFFKKSWNNKVKVAEMSPVFYSETVADILDLIKA